MGTRMRTTFHDELGRLETAIQAEGELVLRSLRACVGALQAQDVDAAGRNLANAKINFVSSGVVVNQNNQLGFSKALVVRDPDGHAIEIEQK